MKPIKKNPIYLFPGITLSREKLPMTLLKTFLVGSIALWSMKLGPIDSIRNTYNVILGDEIKLKSELIDYARYNMFIENPSLSPYDIEKQLAKEVNYNFIGAKINPTEISSSAAWDASENHASNLYDQLIWPSLIKRDLNLDDYYLNSVEKDSIDNKVLEN